MDVDRSLRTNRSEVRSARLDDISELATVERSAAAIFRTVDLTFLVAGPTMDPVLLSSMILSKHVWVAVDPADKPVGFIAGHPIDGSFHIAEVSVHQEWQRKGIAKILIGEMASQVRREGFECLTLTTYRDLEWNGVFYRKVGFVEVSVQQMGARYSEILKEEGEQGLEVTRRCVMRRPL